MPIDLFNGTEWDSLSQKVWTKFEEKRQTRDTFEKKMQLWNNLREVVEVCIVYTVHWIPNSTAKKNRKVLQFQFPFSNSCYIMDKSACIWLVQPFLVLHWIRLMWTCASFRAQSLIFRSLAMKHLPFWMNCDFICNNIAVSFHFIHFTGIIVSLLTTCVLHVQSDDHDNLIWNVLLIVLYYLAFFLQQNTFRKI